MTLKNKKTASDAAMDYDKKHNLIPIKVRASSKNVNQFLALSDKYHISRRQIMNTLIDAFNNGELDVSNKEKTAQIQIKIDHDEYDKMQDRVKKLGMTKAKVFSRLLQSFVDDPTLVLDKLDIQPENRADALIKKLRQIQIEKDGKNPNTMDVSDYKAYESCFGTWPTALYAAGCYDGYDTFVKERQKSTRKFEKNSKESKNELQVILETRMLELEREDKPCNEETFPYPGINVYEEIFAPASFDQILETEEENLEIKLKRN